MVWIEVNKERIISRLRYRIFFFNCFQNLFEIISILISNCSSLSLRLLSFFFYNNLLSLLMLYIIFKRNPGTNSWYSLWVSIHFSPPVYIIWYINFHRLNYWYIKHRLDLCCIKSIFRLFLLFKFLIYWIEARLKFTFFISFKQYLYVI